MKTNRMCSQGVTLPVPVSFEPLEAKVPVKCLQNPDIVDFLKKCVDKDPTRRWSCDKLLLHPYFAQYAAQFGDGAASQTSTHPMHIQNQSAASINSNQSNNNNASELKLKDRHANNKVHYWWSILMASLL